MQTEIGHSEIDIIEYYGAQDPFHQHYTIHIWPNSTNDHNYTSPAFCSNTTSVCLLLFYFIAFKFYIKLILY